MSYPRRCSCCWGASSEELCAVALSLFGNSDMCWWLVAFAFGRDAAGGTEDDAVGNGAVRSGAPHLDCLDCWLLMLVYSFCPRCVLRGGAWTEEWHYKRSALNFLICNSYVDHHVGIFGFSRRSKSQTAIFIPNQWYSPFGDSPTSNVCEGITLILNFLAEICQFWFC